MANKKSKTKLLFLIFWISQFSQVATAQLADSYVTAPRSGPPMQDPDPKPYAITLGLQYPTGVVLELNRRPSPRFSFAAEAGGYFLNDVLLDTSANQGGVKNSLITTAFEGRARLHTSDGPFFIALAVGWQRLWVSGLNGDIAASGSVSGIYITPHVGWLWATEGGLTFGTEFGIQIPIGSRSIGASGLTASNTDNATRALTPLMNALIPYFNLIKIGYSF
jgi:hypothetical protein